VDAVALQNQLRQSALALRYALARVDRAAEAIEDGDIVFAEGILGDLFIQLLSDVEQTETLS
jgi:hypothetical protein